MRGHSQSAAEYDPFGEPIVAPVGTAYGFTGELTDGNGLVYLRARYLAPALGTFASRDPWRGTASAPRTWNGYAWVEGNVVNRVDPGGMQSAIPTPTPTCPPTLQPQPVSTPSVATSTPDPTLVVANTSQPTHTPQAAPRPSANQIRNQIAASTPVAPRSIFTPTPRAALGPTRNGWTRPTGFDQSEYPISCEFTDSPETCLLFQLLELVESETISMLHKHNPLTPEDWIRFAGFVFPDDIWRSLTGHAEGTPGDIKEFYQRFEVSTDEGLCISLYGKTYGRDVTGNVAFGYIGSHAGFSPQMLMVGGGVAQAGYDVLKGLDPSSVDFFTDFGDTPEDVVAVTAGIGLYRLCGTACTHREVQFVLETLRQDYVNASAQSSRALCRPRD